MDLMRKNHQNKTLTEAPGAQLGGDQGGSKGKGREDVEKNDEERKSTPSLPIHEPNSHPRSKRARKSYTAGTVWPRSA